MQCLPAPVLYKQKEDRSKDALTWLFLPLISLSLVSQLARQRFFWFDNETLDPLIKSSVSWSSKTKHMLHFEGCFSWQILQKSYVYIHYNPWQNKEYIATTHTFQYKTLALQIVWYRVRYSMKLPNTTCWVRVILPRQTLLTFSALRFYFRIT